MDIKDLKCQYVEMNLYVNNNCINIIDINDFNGLIIDNNIETLYYGEKIFQDNKIKCFMFVLDSNVFTFSYQLDDGYFKTINDYMEAKSNGFKSLYAYNSAKKYGISGKDEYEALEKKFFEENIKKQKYPIIGLIRKNDFKKTSKSAIAAVCRCDEEEAYNITVINERFEKKYKEEQSFGYHGIRSNYQSFIREYGDYYFINVYITDNYFYNACFAQYDNQKDFFDSLSKYRYTKGNTLFEKLYEYSEDSEMPKCYLMKDTYLIIEEMKKNGYKKFYSSSDYRELDSYAYDPQYIYEKSVRYK